MAGTSAHLELIGNLSGNFKTDYIGDKQTAKLSFTVAHNRRVKKGGEWVDATDWWDCYAFGKLAEQVGQLFEKGLKVRVGGEPQKREYEKEGQRRFVVELEAKEITILTPKGAREGQGASGSGQAPQPAPVTGREPYATKITTKPQARPAPTPPPDFGAPAVGGDDDDIPF
jgi:single-strand DNA-binding protein